MVPGSAILAALIVLYSAMALLLRRWFLSMPLVFVAIGFLLGPGGVGILPLALHTNGVKELTEITLALLLFADASTLSLRRVSEDAPIPTRLLTIGLPLTMFLGAALALGLMPTEGLALAALLGAILAPTDAALGLPIFHNPLVPVRIRRALNVESGLNDGIATPFVSLFLAYAVATEDHFPRGWLASALSQIALGLLVAVVVGVTGGWLLTQTARRGWTSGGSEQIAILGLALAAYLGSLSIHGNGFIAAFVGGIVFGAVTRDQFAKPTEFTETFGIFLSLLVWVIFGALLVPSALLHTTDWRPIVYAVLSLTVVRMLPVALSLVGTHLRPDTIALMGWFGPRGLASVVFTLLIVEQAGEGSQAIYTLLTFVVWTILLSVFAHGLSAQPLSSWYARRLSRAGSKPVELADLPELRRRHALLVGPSSAASATTRVSAIDSAAETTREC
ncbi:MAG: cation:proton antiporter [Ktedonobacterales bacterium]